MLCVPHQAGGAAGIAIWRGGDENKNNDDDYSTRNSGSTPLGAVQPVVTNPANSLLSAQPCQVSSKASPFLAPSWFFFPSLMPHNAISACCSMFSIFEKKKTLVPLLWWVDGMKRQDDLECVISQSWCELLYWCNLKQAFNWSKTRCLWYTKLINSTLILFRSLC